MLLLSTKVVTSAVIFAPSDIGDNYRSRLDREVQPQQAVSLSTASHTGGLSSAVNSLHCGSASLLCIPTKS